MTLYTHVIFSITAVPQSFDPEGLITTYALYRLEKFGIQVRREMSAKNKDFQAVLRVKQPDTNLAMIHWINNAQKSVIKPTWRNLFLLLRLISLDHLAKKMELYFTGIPIEGVIDEARSGEGNHTVSSSSAF